MFHLMYYPFTKLIQLVFLNLKHPFAVSQKKKKKCCCYARYEKNRAEFLKFYFIAIFISFSDVTTSFTTHIYIQMCQVFRMTTSFKNTTGVCFISLQLTLVHEVSTCMLAWCWILHSLTLRFQLLLSLTHRGLLVNYKLHFNKPIFVDI